MIAAIAMLKIDSPPMIHRSSASMAELDPATDEPPLVGVIAVRCSTDERA